MRKEMDVKRELELIKQHEERNKKSLEDWKAMEAEWATVEAELVKRHEKFQEKRFYFTFGTDPRFPYGINDYVVVYAKSIDDACTLFNMVHPQRTPGIVNCAFFYSEESWIKNCEKFYQGREPAEVIRINRNR